LKKGKVSGVKKGKCQRKEKVVPWQAGSIVARMPSKLRKGVGALPVKEGEKGMPWHQRGDNCVPTRVEGPLIDLGETLNILLGKGREISGGKSGDQRDGKKERRHK